MHRSNLPPTYALQPTRVAHPKNPLPRPEERKEISKISSNIAENAFHENLSKLIHHRIDFIHQFKKKSLVNDPIGTRGEEEIFWIDSLSPNNREKELIDVCACVLW